jgi:hypothetical protein
MSAWADDLRFAHQADVCVEVFLLNGQRMLTGVHSVDDESDTVMLYNARHMGDTTTRVRVRLDDIMSLTVTDIRYGVNG